MHNKVQGPGCGGARLRVLSVIHFNGIYGGPQNRNARLAPILEERGIELTVLLPDEPGGAAKELRRRGLDVAQQSLHRPRAVLNPLPNIRLVVTFLPEIMHIRRLIRSRRIDVVLINGSIFPHAAIAARLAGVPVVWQILETRPPMWVRRTAMLFVRNLADVVMSTGMSVAARYPGACAFEDRLIPFFPPVDTTEFRPDEELRRKARGRLGVPDKGVLVGMVANLTPQKGHRHFLAVAARLIAGNPAVHVRCVGQEVATHTAYADRLRQQAEENGLVASGRFSFYDAGTRIAEFLPAFDVFMLTSEPLSEGIPTSLLEAMACGVPVVATDVGAIREAIDSGREGYVVAAVDEEQLAKAASKLIGDAALRREMGRLSRKKAEAEFDLSRTADAHERAFTIAMAHKTGAR